MAIIFAFRYYELDRIYTTYERYSLLQIKKVKHR